MIYFISVDSASIAQLVEQRTENPRVAGSIPARGTILNFEVRKWLSGRASPCQGEGRGFESRLPLHFLYLAAWPSGKAEVCKTFITGSNLGAASSKILGLLNSGVFCIYILKLEHLALYIQCLTRC